MFREVLSYESRGCLFHHISRGEQLLRRAGFRCGIRRTQRWMEERGCGYSLRVQTGQIARAVALLRGQQLPLGKVYLQQGDGELEEMAL